MVYAAVYWWIRFVPGVFVVSSFVLWVIVSFCVRGLV